MDIQIYILINIYIFIYYFCNPFDNTMVIVLQFHLALRGSDNRENPDGYHDPLVSGGGGSRQHSTCEPLRPHFNRSTCSSHYL